MILLAFHIKRVVLLKSGYTAKGRLNFKIQ